MCLALVMLMAGFIKLCSVHTPSNNPKLPKHRQLPGMLLDLIGVFVNSGYLIY